jgi:hypothetical protein
MSLKGDKYETLEEVNFRLANTVVMYDGKPVYITRVREIDGAEDKKEVARVFFVELPYQPRGFGAPEQKEVRKYLSSRNFDLAPFKMGYLNFKGKALYASRSPVRQNQQGLNAKTLKLTNMRGNREDDVSFASVIASQGFVDMVNGKYPTFADVGDLLGDAEHSSVAISRTFALAIDHDLEALLLMHKGVKCGIALKDDKALRLPPKFHFLRHEAEECRIPLA